MTSLRQIVEEKKTGGWPHSPCVKLAYNDSPLCLRLEFRNGDLLLLPWARFVSACFEDGTLTIEFHDRSVTVTGSNLETVSDAIGESKLAGLRELPADYSKLSDGKAYVTNLAVEIKGA